MNHTVRHAVIVALVILPALGNAADDSARLNELEKRVAALEKKGSTLQSHQADTKSIEAIELLKIFSQEKSVDYTAFPWETGTNTLIEWQHEGIKSADNLPYPYYRDGKVVVTNNGKVTHTVLGKDVKNGYWDIRLTGARSGYTAVEMHPDATTYDSPAFEIAEQYIVKTKECDDAATYHVSFSLIQLKDKKPFWLKSEFSAGSAGSETSYTITYDTPPDCDNT